MRLVRTSAFQAYAFHKTPKSRDQAAGLAFCVRVPGGWRKLSLSIRLPEEHKGHGCVTFEVATWKTLPDHKTRTRLKTFVRVKVGLGGRRRWDEVVVDYRADAGTTAVAALASVLTMRGDEAGNERA